jgi:hypothetical protein
MADKQSLGVWEFPKPLDQMTNEKIADSMAVALERLEQFPPS